MAEWVTHDPIHACFFLIGPVSVVVGISLTRALMLLGDTVKSLRGDAVISVRFPNWQSITAVDVYRATSNSLDTIGMSSAVSVLLTGLVGYFLANFMYKRYPQHGQRYMAAAVLGGVLAAGLMTTNRIMGGPWMFYPSNRERAYLCHVAQRWFEMSVERLARESQ